MPGRRRLPDRALRAARTTGPARPARALAARSRLDVKRTRTRGWRPTRRSSPGSGLNVDPLCPTPDRRPAWSEPSPRARSSTSSSWLLTRLRLWPDVPGSRRLSQRISEGDGIAIIACVDDAGGARDAERQGAKALAVSRLIEGIREATSLPLLWIGGGEPEGRRRADAPARGRVHPAPPGAGRRRPGRGGARARARAARSRDLPARRLGAKTPTPTRSTRCWSSCRTCRPASSRSPGSTSRAGDEVLALERAGIDAVLVGVGRIAHLVGHQPFEV